MMAISGRALSARQAHKLTDASGERGVLEVPGYVLEKLTYFLGEFDLNGVLTPFCLA